MELLDFITELSKPQATNDSERYWRIIVNCFLFEKLEQLELGSLLSKFKQCYGKYPPYDGNLLALLKKPQFKSICIVEPRDSTIFILPSEFILRVLCARLDPDPSEELNNQHLTNNNYINILRSNNPFAMDAQREIKQNDASYEARFGRLTLEELNCGICFDLLKEAVEGNCCRNIFCSPCIEQNGRKCPNCRRIVEWTANEPIRRLIRKKPIQCEYEECGIWSTVSEIEQHRVKCEFNPNSLVSCQKCQQRIVRKLIEEHLSNVCEMVTVPCRNCGCTFVRKDVRDHETQLCELSSSSARMTNALTKCKENHWRHLQYCQHSPLLCPNSANGCPVQMLGIQKRAMKRHRKTCDFILMPCTYGCKKEVVAHDFKEHKCDHMPVECRACRKVMKQMQTSEHLGVCPERYTSCPNHCGDRYKPVMSKHHLQQCARRLEACLRCGEYLPLNAHEEHQLNHCPRREVTCSGCQDKYTVSFIDEHMATQCPGVVVACDLCHERFTANHYNRHLSMDCPKRQVPCSSCKEKMPVAEYEEHRSKFCLQRKLSCLMCKKPYIAGDENEHKSLCPMRTMKCPSCDKSVTAYSYGLHTQHCGQILFSDLNGHNNRIRPQSKIPCKECRELIAPEDNADHLANQCKARVVTCDKCLARMRAKKYNAHALYKCPKRQQTCTRCQQVTTAIELNEHRAKLCPKREISCRKCSSVVIVCNMNEHLDQCQKEHCKWCHDYVDLDSLAVHESCCQEQPVKCPDCHEEVTVRSYKDHSDQCPYRTIQCNDCNETLYAVHVSDHKANSCVQRRVICDKCQESVLASFKLFHDDTCPAE